jgi:hypothetical protein
MIAMSDIIIWAMIVGAAIMLLSIIMMILAIGIDSLPLPLAANGLATKVATVATHGIDFGLALFMFSLSLLFAMMIAEGLWNGEYVLSFQRSGGRATVISWEKNPVRFAVQTLLFAAGFAYLYYRSVKTFSELR